MKNTKHLLVIASIAAGITLSGKPVHAEQMKTTKIPKSVISNSNNYSIITVKLNDRLDIVKDIQSTLNLYFGAGLAEDGIYGKLTEDAVKNVQNKLGINADGMFGPRTAKALLNYIKNTPIEDKNGFSPVASKIQQQLADYGYKLKIDGNLSSYSSVLAVKHFQKSKGLPVTGKVDVNLVNKLCENNKKQGDETKDFNSATNYFILVNSSDHLARIYKRINGEWKEIKCFDIFSGKINKGDYLSGIQGKEVKLNGVVMKNFTQIDGLDVFYSAEKESGYGLRISNECAEFLSKIPSRTTIKVF